MSELNPTENEIATPQATSVALISDTNGAFAKRVLDLFGDERKKSMFIAFAVNVLRRSKRLFNADKASLLQAFLRCAEAKMLPDDINCYIIPYKNSKGIYEAKFMLSAQGYITMFGRADIYISANAVYSNDSCECVNGDWQHRYKPCEARGELIGFVAFAKMPNGTTQSDFMTKQEVDTIMETSNAYRAGLKTKDSIWHTHYNEMGKKTVIRRIAKKLPKDSFAFDTEALLADDANDYAPVDGRVVGFAQPSQPTLEDYEIA